jgi:hypothetical protein
MIDFDFVDWDGGNSGHVAAQGLTRDGLRDRRAMTPGAEGMDFGTDRNRGARQSGGRGRWRARPE